MAASPDIGSRTIRHVPAIDDRTIVHDAVRRAATRLGSDEVRLPTLHMNPGDLLDRPGPPPSSGWIVQRPRIGPRTPAIELLRAGDARAIGSDWTTEPVVPPLACSAGRAWLVARLAAITCVDPITIWMDPVPVAELDPIVWPGYTPDTAVETSPEEPSPPAELGTVQVERRTRIALTCALLSLRERYERLSGDEWPGVHPADVEDSIVVVGEFLLDTRRDLWLVGMRQLDPDEYPNATVADAASLVHRVPDGIDPPPTRWRKTFPTRSAVRAARWLTLPRPGDVPARPEQSTTPCGPTFHPGSGLVELPIETGVVVADRNGPVVLDAAEYALWRLTCAGVPSWRAAAETATAPDKRAEISARLARIASWHERGLIGPEAPPETTTATVHPPRQRFRSLDWNVQAYYRYLDVVVSVRFPSSESLRLVAPAMCSMRRETASAVDATISIAPSRGRWSVRAPGAEELVVSWHQLPSAVRAAVIGQGDRLRRAPAMPASLIRSHGRTLVLVATSALRAHVCDSWVRAGRSVEADQVVGLSAGGRVRATPLSGWEIPNTNGWVASDRPWGTARPLIGLSGQLANFWNAPASRQTPGGSWRPTAIVVVRSAPGPIKISHTSALTVARHLLDRPDQTVRPADLAPMIALLTSTRCVSVTGKDDALAGWARSGARLPPTGRKVAPSTLDQLA